MALKTTTCSLTCWSQRFDAVVPVNVVLLPATSKHKTNGKCSFTTSPSLLYLSTCRAAEIRKRSKILIRINFAYNGDQSGDLTHIGELFEQWGKWIPGILITAVIPFLTKKWGPFAKVKDDIDEAEVVVNAIADKVEEVAVKVEKVAEEIEEGLPEGGKLKNTLTSVENVAKEVAKDAELVEDMVHKVEEVEKDMESIVDSLSEQPNTTGKVE